MNRRLKARLPLGIFSVALIFAALGISRGEMEIVFRKAVNICLECIGLG